MPKVLLILRYAMLVKGVMLLKAISKEARCFCFYLGENRQDFVECFERHCTNKLGQLIINHVVCQFYFSK